MIQSRSCPSCLRRVDVSQFKLGARVRCPYCGSEFQIQPQVGHSSAHPPKPGHDKKHRPTVPRSNQSKSRTRDYPRLQVEGYERSEGLAKGAMGSVYKAYQTKLRRKVALKVLALEHADKKGFVERFNREAATGARITHRNVVRVYDILTGKSYDEDDVSTEVHVISMEYVDGPHLRTLNETQDLRDDKLRALDYFRQICCGVSAAHERGIVHRDLKPENIMLDRETDVLKVADFGLAYFVDRDVGDAVWDTRTRMTMGTVAYMPPEQGRDAKRVVESGDVYSLGRILYEMLTGSLPDGTYPPASTICRDLPESMDRLIEKCLMKDPEDRYQSAGELLEAYDECVAERNEALGSKPGAEDLPQLEPEQVAKAEPEELQPAQSPPVLRPPTRHVPLSARYPTWALVGLPLLLGLLIGAWLVRPSPAELADGGVWLLDGANERAIAPHTVLEGFPEAKGGLWRRSDRYLDHPGAAGTATVVQGQPAIALGDELGVGALEIERRLEWENEGDNALRQTKLGLVERLVAVGFIDDGSLSWVGIDEQGDCYVFEDKAKRPCGLGRPVRTPARIQLRQVRERIEITIDNQDVLPERLAAPQGSSRLILLCQNQFCRFDPKRR